MMRHANDMPNSLDIVLQKSSLAERRVRECRKIVEQQLALVARYKAADRDASSSEALLGEIQKSLDVFEIIGPSKLNLRRFAVKMVC
jgi:hypothetical protein